MSADAYDDLVTRAIMDDVRVAPRFAVFCGVDTNWRVCDTDLVGAFVVSVFSCNNLDEALAMTRLLRKAEALQYV